MNRMTKAAVFGMALALAAPMAAEAQSRYDRRDDRREYRQDRREDRREFRQERREDRRDWRRGDYDNRREFRQDRREFRRDRRDDRRDFRQDRREYRQEQRWNRNNRNWWRGRTDFRDYRGARRGYWYAPSYGYYRVEPRYQSYRWQRGHYLPHTYRSYYVRDPYAYGLRQAPRGYRYVHAGNDIVLIAVATGLIASVLSGVF
jgi:Ni/Co efflux regulator RcnB